MRLDDVWPLDAGDVGDEFQELLLVVFVSKEQSSIAT